MLDGAGAATAPMLAAFHHAHPDVDVRVQRMHADRVFDAVLDASVDVALLHGPVHDERIVLGPLFNESASPRSPRPASSPTPPP